MENTRGFVRFKNELFESILLLDLIYPKITGRQIKAILLILRLTVGCNRDWAKLGLSEFSIVGINSSHTRQVIEPLLENKIIIWKSKGKLFRINIEYLSSESIPIVNPRRKRLKSLIHLNIPFAKSYQNGNSNSTNLEGINIPKRENWDSQFGNNSTRELDTVKDKIKDSNKNSDKESFVKNSFKATEKVHPLNFSPTSNEEYVALNVFKRLEPHNPDNFSFYLYAVNKVPVELVLQWASEIEQDNLIKNKGAVFVTKVKKYLSSYGT